MIAVLIPFIVLLFTQVDSWFMRLVLAGLVVAAFFYLGPAWVAVPALFVVVLLIKSMVPTISKF